MSHRTINDPWIIDKADLFYARDVAAQSRNLSDTNSLLMALGRIQEILGTMPAVPYDMCKQATQESTDNA